MPAPRVVATGEIHGREWLETEALPGCGAVSGHFDDRSPVDMARALGLGLRRFHDQLPGGSCPWTWSVTDRLAAVPAAGRRLYAGTPPLDLVVCHGDACNPNFLLDDELTCTGYVDLGRLGVADRWADIAPATMSLGWNFGEGLTDSFLEGYGINRDQRKLTYYQRLWDADL